MTAFCSGYYVGALASVLVPALIFWYVGRWGWFGLIIRIVCAGFLLLRILSWLAHPPGC